MGHKQVNKKLEFSTLMYALKFKNTNYWSKFSEIYYHTNITTTFF